MSAKKKSKLLVIFLLIIILPSSADDGSDHKRDIVPGSGIERGDFVMGSGFGRIADNYIYFNSTPIGADISINGSAQEKRTPVKMPIKLRGNCEITLSLNGDEATDNIPFDEFLVEIYYDFTISEWNNKHIPIS